MGIMPAILTFFANIAGVRRSYRRWLRTGIALALWWLPHSAAAQSLPPIGAIADDAQMSLLIKQCQEVLAIDEKAADKLFGTIVSAMLDEHGKDRTDAALDVAFNRIVKDVKAKGLDDWCQWEAAIWMDIRYPELAKK